MVYFINVNENDNWHVVHSEHCGCLNRTMHCIRLGKFASASRALRSAKASTRMLVPAFIAATSFAVRYWNPLILSLELRTRSLKGLEIVEISSPLSFDSTSNMKPPLVTLNLSLV